MEVAWDDLGRVAWKRGIEGQVTTIRHFEIRCMDWLRSRGTAYSSVCIYVKKLIKQVITKEIITVTVVWKSYLNLHRF